jgi:hypothetical protein
VAVAYQVHNPFSHNFAQADYARKVAVSTILDCYACSSFPHVVINVISCHLADLLIFWDSAGHSLNGFPERTELLDSTQWE